MVDGAHKGNDSKLLTKIQQEADSLFETSTILLDLIMGGVAQPADAKQTLENARGALAEFQRKVWHFDACTEFNDDPDTENVEACAKIPMCHVEKLYGSHRHVNTENAAPCSAGVPQALLGPAASAATVDPESGNP